MKIANLVPSRSVILAFGCACLLADGVKGADLLHRYSFTSNAMDSIGTAHGIPTNGVTFSGGSAVLNGTTAYIDLPNNLVTGLTSITIEMWVTNRMTADNWSRLFDFGNSNAGEGNAGTGTRYMFLSPRSGPGTLRGGYTITGGGAGEQLLEWQGNALPTNVAKHVVWTTDGVQQKGWLYVDGVLVSVNNNMTLTPASLGETLNDWLGRSQFSADAYFNGSYDEVRIYNGAMTAEEVLESFQLGPDTCLQDGPATVIRSPASLNVYELNSVTLSAQVAGRRPMTIKWFRDGELIPGATNAAYVIDSVTAGEQGAQFYVVVSNVYQSTSYNATSATATLTVTLDYTPPTVLRVVNLGLTNVLIQFSERVSEASATNVANYVFTNGMQVLNARLTASGSAVVLTTPLLSAGSNYVLVLNEITDRAQAANRIAANTTIGFQALLYTTSDIGGTGATVSATTLTNGFNLSAAGADIGGTNDQFGFLVQNILFGDFDMQARLEGLTASDLWAKAGLMVRESIETNNTAGRYAAVLATPGMAGCWFSARLTNGVQAVSQGNFPVNYPDTWMRLKREGNVFSGYASFDGRVWTLLGTAAIDIGQNVYFGYVASSRTNTVAATAGFRDTGMSASTLTGLQPTGREPMGPCTRRTGLVISEIMYRPAPRQDGKNLEFIEIYNSNPFFHDMSGYKLAGSVDYTFPAGTIIPGGGFFVVAASPADVAGYYGLQGVLGPYTNTLKTSGTIKLLDEQGAVLLEIPYSNQPPWPVGADGTGHSIVMARPSYGEGDAGAWEISSRLDGSPGRWDSYLPIPLRSVCINEILAHTQNPALEDYIELYNHGQQPVDVSGCVLTDSPDTNKFVIPAQTIIPGGGFAVFYQSTLGFGLKASGERIYFKGPDGAVIDAIEYGDQADGVSYGRFPDGASAFYMLSTNTPGTNNSSFRQPEIVINEIMYHPISGNDDDQYVELYNPGTNGVDLSGWRLRDGITFSFSTNTIIPPDGYLVVARNRTNLLAKYPTLNAGNTVGNFGGRLSHGGERIELARPELLFTTNNHGAPVTNVLYVTVDEVTYGTGGRWGEWADGGGSSLERRDSRACSRLAANWADSDESAKAPWTSIEFTGVLDNGSSYSNLIANVQIGQMDAGECLVDNIEVVPVGGTNYVANPTFENGLIYWTLMGCFTRSSLETGGAGYQSNYALHLRTRNRLFTIANAAQGALSNTSLTTNQTATLRFKARWLRGCRDIVMRLHGNWLEAAGTMDVPSNLGTPGARNSRAVSNAGPAIYEVTHLPALPAAGQPCVVVARVHDPDGVASITLNYRVDPAAAYTSVAMRDDGTGGDVVGGDGIFSATIPGQASGALVAFTITALDNLGARSRFPELLDDRTPDRECLVRFGEPQPLMSFGVYHLWLSQSNMFLWNSLPVLSNEDIDGTLVYNNRVIYNMKARYAGSPYHQNFDGPAGTRACHYNWEMPKDDRLLGHVSFNKIHWIGNDIQDDTATQNNNDSTLQREQAANMFLRGLGQPWVYRRYVKVFVNGVTRGQLMEDALRPSISVPDMYFPNDKNGYLYKIQPWFEGDLPTGSSTPWANKSWAYLTNVTTTGGAKKTPRYRWWYQLRQTADNLHNFNSVYALVDAAAASGASNYVARMQSVADMENFMRLVAANHAAGNWDCYGIQNAQNVYGYVSPNVKWTLFMFDFSIVLGNRISWNPGANLFNATPDYWQGIYTNPTFRRMLLRAYKELANGVMQATNFNPLLDAKYAAFQASGISATSPDPIKTWVTQARTTILNAVTNEDTLNFALSTSNFLATGSNYVVLNGTAPVEIESIRVNGVEYPLTWLTKINWTLALALSAGTNSFVIQAYDYYGRPTSHAPISVTAVYTNAEPPAAGNVGFSEIMYRPVVAGAEYVELYNASGQFTFDLTGWRINGLDYVFPGGTLLRPRQFILLVKNRAAFAAAYGQAAADRITDVYPGSLDADGETLTLFKPAAGGEEVVDRVRYEPGLPWPQSANGQGASLQIVDFSRSHSRVANWKELQGWRFASFTGTNTSTPPPILMILPQGVGDVYIDDVCMVAGTNAEVGVNVITNGDFESPLAGTWYVATNLTNSMIVSDVKHSGNSCLLLRATSSGNFYNTSINQTNAALAVSNIYTLSFWYLPVSLTNLQMRTRSSTFTPNFNVAPALPYTPGFSNSSLTSLPQFPDIWLNEVQPSSAGLATDNYGEHEPWLEIYNAGTVPVSLANWFLSDNYTNVTLWNFPADAVIEPGQFMVVWADGQPEQTAGTNLHASFRLTPGAGSACLAANLGGELLIIDYLNYTNLPDGWSYGDAPDGQPFYRQNFHHPTPCGTNDPAPPPLTVAINEWMASNTRTLPDPATGQYEDWFELFNYGTNPVNLDGCYLTDNPSGNPLQFKVPSGYVIPAGGYLLVWADGRPGANSSNDLALHVNFKLDRLGEAIALYNTDGSLIDAINFGPQQSDVSEGRYPDGFGGIVALGVPTPGRPNQRELVGENTPPQIAPISDITVAEGGPIQFYVVAWDMDTPAQTLYFSLGPEAPAGASINNLSGEFQWSPDESQGPGVFPMSVVVTDSGTPPLSATQAFTIVVTEVNQAPVLENPGNFRVLAGRLLEFDVTATDADLPANSLSYSLGGNVPAGASIDRVTGHFSWTPLPEQAGTQAVTVVVTDNGQPPLSATQSVQVVVVPPPDNLVVSITNSTQVVLKWRAFPGQTYKVWAASDLSAPPAAWSQAGPPLTATGESLYYTEMIQPGQRRYYRIEMAQ